MTTSPKDVPPSPGLLADLVEHFQDPALVAGVESAHQALLAFLGKSAMGIAEFWNPNEHVLEIGDYFTAEEPLLLRLPSIDEHLETTLGDLSTLVDEATSAIRLSPEVVQTNRAVYVRVHCSPASGAWDPFLELVDRIRHPRGGFQSEVPFQAMQRTLRLFAAATPAVFLTIKEERCSDEDPCVYDGEFQIQIAPGVKLKAKDAIELAQAFIFQLHLALPLRFEVQARPSMVEEDPETWDPQAQCTAWLNQAVPPPMLGDGLAEPYRLFNMGAAASHVEHRIITFVRVIEYVSQTVIHESFLSAMFANLDLLRGRRATANEAFAIAQLCQEHQGLQRDRQRIEATVLRCCDSFALLSRLPPFVAGKKVSRPEAPSKDRHEALARFATCIVDTRNALVHAKANYKVTGNECPADQLEALVSASELAARCCIEWLSMRASRSIASEAT